MTSEMVELNKQDRHFVGETCSIECYVCYGGDLGYVLWLSFMCLPAFTLAYGVWKCNPRIMCSVFSFHVLFICWHEPSFQRAKRLTSCLSLCQTDGMVGLMIHSIVRI